jgi:hypothetical protein
VTVSSPGFQRRQCSLYRALLVLYPRSFRRGYREPMVQLFGDRVPDVGAKAWLRTIPDLARTAPKERIEATMAHMGSGTRVVAIALIVLGAVVVSIGAGGGAVPVVALAVIALLVSQRRLVAAVPSRGERAPLRHAVVQTWWAPVAALLGAMELFFGFGTIFEAHNLGGRIIGSSLLMAIGVVMIYGLVRRPFSRQAGNMLILLATIPPLLLFWVIVPPIMAIVVWVGVISSGFSEPSVAPAH